MTHVVVVAGPPCSGKSTLVREQMQPGDLVIEFDRLAVAVGSPDSHDHPPTLVPVAGTLMGQLLDMVRRGAIQCRAVWVVKCSPTGDELALADEVLVAPVDKALCLRRAAESGRSARTMDFIRAWTPPAGY